MKLPEASPVKGRPVRLDEIGRVIDSVQNDKIASWFNDNRAIVLAIQRQPDANTVAVVDLVRNRLPQFRALVPPSINMAVLMDRSVSIRDSVADVKVEAFNVDASYGGFGGGTVEITTKGGTNQLHGSGTYMYTNRRLAALNRFQSLTYQHQQIVDGCSMARRCHRNAISTKTSTPTQLSSTLHVREVRITVNTNSTTLIP